MDKWVFFRSIQPICPLAVYDRMAPGTLEVVALVVFGVLIFGVDKIPKLARSVGLAKGEYQKAVNEVARPSKAEIDLDRGGQTDEALSEDE